ncbi:MAG: class I SAM-dependent methyltransferase [Parcubacteria group bacterium]|nr:class I SAM-dependent methyltransferase [Parcubacteria group bacterium]
MIEHSEIYYGAVLKVGGSAPKAHPPREENPPRHAIFKFIAGQPWHNMHKKFVTLTPRLYDYLVAHSAKQDQVLSELAAETAQLGGWSVMQIAPDQGALLTLLCRLMSAKFAVEVGTFTGYSAISIARGLASNGRLITCEMNPEWAAIAKKYFAQAGLSDRIDLKLGAALETLRALPRAPQIDFAFIDADKTNYRPYYEEILSRLRSGGLITFDNTLWGGSVASRDKTDRETESLRALNDFLVADERVEIVMLPVADGLTLARKRD